MKERASVVVVVVVVVISTCIFHPFRVESRAMDPIDNR